MAFADPFATAADDTADAAPNNAPATNTGPWEDQPEESRTRVSLTFKASSGYDAPWVVVEGPTLAAVYGQVSGENAEALKAVFNLVAGGASYFQKLYASVEKPGAQRTGGQAGAQQRRQPSGKPEGATQAPNGEQRFCEHGQRQYKSGFSQKNGKKWEAFDCPDGICEREWANNRR
ncbi:hypothetical protein [Amycolatopsis cihanbeyliensis]|uniref:Uncharacterized protein n=1 Tax=Amycolatopsis cihanbeyliensis TaxID=1128664 RepID=A0A542DNI3_AMYCI|nr:hypothetical protein [Amycolatopsis cihanbeyliensis]TQJ04658.1 hypothetical protein FB471_4461 [Amycolatopsis cihanbeyliensis]